jgi:hypothetical protein
VRINHSLSIITELKMSFISKLTALSLLSGVLAATPEGLGVAPINLSLKPMAAASYMTRRQVASADGESAVKTTRSGWATHVKIGSQEFNLVVSTQDADTWVVSDQVKCTNGPDAPPNTPQPPCHFAAKYKTPGSFQPYEGGANAPILSGKSAGGKVGYDSVTVGGVTIPKQVIGLVDDTVGTDDAISGTLGLGSISQSDIGYAANQTALVYNPVFASMVANKLIKNPVFSIALNGAGGSLSFGGFPKSAKIDSSSWTSAPLFGDSWAFKADGYFAETETKQIAINMLLDVHSPGSYLPKRLSDAINGKLPAAQFRQQDGLYNVGCDIKNAKVGLIIGGKQFAIKDLVAKDPSKPGACLSLIGAFNSSSNGVMGENFFKSVVTVFDPTNKRIQFAKQA